MLTEREFEILNLLSKGLTNDEIARVLIISHHTVKAHIANIFNKLHVKNRICAAVKYVTEVNPIFEDD